MGRLINSIVAVCPNMGIGNKGNLPWHPVRLSKEFRHFQKMTSTPSVEGKCNAVIMGRKTWFSIPEKNRPLKNRINIVLSRELKELPDGAHYLARDLDSALDLLDSSDLQEKVDLVWIIGGSALYKIQESLQMLEIQSNTHKMLERLSRSTVGSGNQLERSLLHFYAVILSTHFHDQIITQCIGVVQDKIIRKCKSYRESAQEKSEQSMLQAETLQQDRREAALLANDKLEEEALESPASHRLFVTRILQDFESDTFMPEINLNKFKLLPEFPDVPTGIQEEKGIQFKYEVYERITSA